LVIHGKVHDQSQEGKIWWFVRTMIRSLFMAGHDTVILDSTNVKVGGRSKWRSTEWYLDFVELKTDVETCKQRAIDTEQEYLLPVIDRMAEKYVSVSESEKGYKTKEVINI
jgi:hypothetical protein